MSDRSSLQRRFIQNQQDCTYTVLALLPTAVENICEKFPVEQVSDELQKQRSERRAAASRLLDSSEPATAPSKAGSVNEDDAASVPSSQPDSYVHGSQVLQQEGKDTTDNTRSESGARKSKAQLWDEMKILCEPHLPSFRRDV